MKLKGVELNSKVAGRKVIVIHSTTRWFTKGLEYEVFDHDGCCISVRDNGKSEDSCYDLDDDTPSEVDWEWVPLIPSTPVTKSTRTQRKQIAAAVRRAEGELAKALLNAVTVGIEVSGAPVIPCELSYQQAPPKKEIY